MCLGMKNNKNTELLAPAGRWEALCAAVQNGADAVYIGEQSFSARKNAQNFTWEEVEQAVRYCHVRGVRVHLALNTLVSDKELKTYELCYIDKNMTLALSEDVYADLCLIVKYYENIREDANVFYNHKDYEKALENYYNRYSRAFLFLWFLPCWVC